MIFGLARVSDHHLGDLGVDHLSGLDYLRRSEVAVIEDLRSLALALDELEVIYGLWLEG